MLESHTLAGNAGKDAELVFLPSGTALATFSVAINHRWQNNQRTQWYHIRVYGQFAETVAKYVKRGDFVICSGDKIEIEAYTNRDNEPDASMILTAQRVRWISRQSDHVESFESIGDVNDIPF